jgi:hypothetical protein
MFAITINQGGLIGGLINRDQLGLPEGTHHFVINELEFENIEQLTEHIVGLSNQVQDRDIVWRFRSGTHSVDVQNLRSLLSAHGITLTALEAQQLQGPATEV